MSNENSIEELPAVIRFMDRFLQEQNIKWLLALGAAILVGSSFMMVVRYWDHALFSAPVKVLVMLVYTALIERAGWWSHQQLALPTTGIVLLAMTVVLLPLLFYGVSWVYVSSQLPPLQAAGVYTGLLVAVTAFGRCSAQGIFTHFLHHTPLTFLYSYSVLCLAAACLPLLPASTVAASVAALVLWAVFFIGSIKISRHTFWLVEAHRYPRIFGFFPIALLGGLFLTLFCFRLAPSIAWEWIGLGCVMTAMPVLLTADTVARVFQQRSGGLLRPLPWSIIAPILLGLLLCLLGVLISLCGLQPGHNPLALSPAAILAAIQVAWVAQRTRQYGFAWGAVLLLLIGYQFLPFFFRQAAVNLVHSSAAAIQEDTLPLAFYGLTYWPLLMLMTAAAQWLHTQGKPLFVQPLRDISSGLGLLGLGLACSHGKALFPVAAAMTLLFALQIWLFRRPVLIRAVIAAWLLSAIGWLLFSPSVLGWRVSGSTIMATLGVALLVLLWPGIRIDRAISRLHSKPHYDCQWVGLVGAILLPWLWLWTEPGDVNGVMVGVPLVLLGLHSLYWCHQRLSTYTLILLHVAMIWLALDANTSDETAVILSVSMLLCQWLLNYALAACPGSVFNRAFVIANQTISRIGLLLAAGLMVLPLSLSTLLSATHWQPDWLLLCLAVTAWLLDAARCLLNRRLLSLALISLFILAATCLSRSQSIWVPALWVGLAISLPLFFKWRPGIVKHRAGLFLQTQTETFCTRFLIGISRLSVLWFPPAMMVAGIGASAGLLILFRQHSGLSISRLLKLANWQLLVFTVSIGHDFAVTHVFAYVDSPETSVWLVAALISTLSVCFWQYRTYTTHTAENSGYHRLLLRLVSVLSLLAAVQAVPASGWQVLIVPLVLAIGAGSELYAAFAHQWPARVWVAQALMLLIGAYCHVFIDLGGQSALMLVLLLALIQSSIARRLEHTQRWAVFAQPARLFGFIVPALLVLAGLMKPFGSLNTLAMLGSAGFYFHQSRCQHKTWLMFAAAAIANAVLFKCSLALSLTDPQFFMMPAGATVLALTHYLRQDIDEHWRNRCYYAGALTILVSPLFAIVGHGSWWHLLVLLVASVLMVILAMGLRVRALVYTGSAFLIADLLAMMIRSTLDNPQLLPLVGVVVGGAVLGLAAWSERHREHLLQRMRIVSAQLQQWA